MGLLPWNLNAVFNSSSLPIQRPCNPRLTVRCEYPEMGMPPNEVTFRLALALLRPSTTQVTSSPPLSGLSSGDTDEVS